jgi:hypothetical protein
MKNIFLAYLVLNKHGIMEFLTIVDQNTTNNVCSFDWTWKKKLIKKKRKQNKTKVWTYEEINNLNGKSNKIITKLN